MINSLETGGSERQFAALARSLSPEAFRLHLGCIRQQGDAGEGLGEIAQFGLGGSLYGYQSLKTRLRLARHLRQREIGIAHAFDFYTNLTLVPAARLARVPAIIASHRQLGDLMTATQACAQKEVFRWCDRVVCNSRAGADWLTGAGIPRRKVVVIGNGLPPEAFAAVAPAIPRRAGLLRVGMIARMNARYKNHRVFLHAAARLGARSLNLEFLLVGDGPLRPELEREAESLGLRGQARFLGDRRDVSAVLASLDVTVLPSSSEGLSNVILESMAAGVPVVATGVGGNPELVSDKTGLLVPPNDPVALARALEVVLADAELRTRLGECSRKFVLENFTLDRMRDQYRELYYNLLAERKRRSVTRAGSTPHRPAHRPLRVVIVAPSLRYVGGQSVQADLLLKHWRGDSAVQAQLLPIDPPLPRVLAWAERVLMLRTVIREPIYLASLWRGFRDADVAHIFSASYWSFLLAPAPAWVLARLRGKKTVINYRSGEARDHLRRSRVARFILGRADRLVVPSGYLVKVFRLFSLRAEVVPNIADLTQFHFRVRKPLTPNLVCTRGFHPYYCVDVVVMAFAVVKQAFPAARLCLVGKGPLEQQIRSLVRDLGLSDVNFAGVASRQEIGRYYDDADIFINASWLDNMPVSVLEAFAAGTPVVTTAPEGIRHLVEHERTGLLSEPGDVAALARNVIRLLRDPELPAFLASNAYQQSRQYRWEAVRDQWLEIYRSLPPQVAPRPVSAADEAAREGSVAAAESDERTSWPSRARGEL
ncbi:MAG TPA: glycosyltransferase [Terriglobia bacterium]|nr:glycosyltransferase [Terriglobia bacterium]